MAVVVLHRFAQVSLSSRVRARALKCHKQRLELNVALLQAFIHYKDSSRLVDAARNLKYSSRKEMVDRIIKQFLLLVKARLQFRRRQMEYHSIVEEQQRADAALRMERDAASCTISKAMRMHQAHQEVNRRRQRKVREHDAAVKIQSMQKVVVAKRTAQERRDAHLHSRNQIALQNQEEEQQEDFTFLEELRQAEEALEKLHQSDEDLQNVAATIIQSFYKISVAKRETRHRRNAKVRKWEDLKEKEQGLASKDVVEEAPNPVVEVELPGEQVSSLCLHLPPQTETEIGVHHEEFGASIRDGVPHEEVVQEVEALEYLDPRLGRELAAAVIQRKVRCVQAKGKSSGA